MNDLALPENRELLPWFRSRAVHMSRGPRSAALNYRSIQKYDGRGERSGKSPLGRVSDLDIVLSVIRSRLVFRRPRVAPLRRTILLVDLLCIDDSSASRRLLGASVLLAGVILSMPQTTLTIVAVGSTTIPPPITLAGVSGFATARRVLAGYRNQSPRRRISPGAIRLALAADPLAHVVLVTHYVQPTLFSGLSLPYGGTLALVEPPVGSIFDRRGASGGLAALEPALDPLEDRYSRLAAIAKRKQIRTLTVSGRGDLLDALGRALDGRPE